MKELTLAEEQIMQIIWKLEKAFVKDIVDNYTDSQPAYNTIATLLKIMENKGFVGHKKYGNSFQYYPLITKEEYTNSFFKSFASRFFGNSYKKMVSFMAKSDDLSVNEINDLMNTIEEIKNQKQQEL